MPPKTFRLSAEQIRPVATGYGGCMASDRIVVDGARVGFCYREPTSGDNPDSGWRFLAGDETENYMANAANLGIYDVNTIANYDPDIIVLLDSPVDSAFERDAGGMFVAVEFEPPDD